MFDVFILGCGTKKALKPMPAIDLYIGIFYRDKLRYLRSIVGDRRILILSAEHGLIEPDKIIEPYDTEMGSEKSPVTTEMLARQARDLGVSGSRALLLAGRSYAAPLVGSGIDAVPITNFMDPDKTRMGYQREWLRKNLGKMPTTRSTIVNSETENLEIMYISPDDLIPYERNARTHSEAQVDKIVASIQEFGFLNPVLIDKEHVVIAGHGRLKAAKRLGLLEVPCIQFEHLTDAQRRAYTLADNRIAEDSTWDPDILMLEMEELSELGFDTSATGFTETDLKALGFEFEQVLEMEDAEADPSGEVKVTVTFAASDFDAGLGAIKRVLEEAGINVRYS